MASEVIERAARMAIECLEDRGISYALIGGLAVQLWGRLRSTLDVDLLVVLSPAELGALAGELEHAGFCPRRPPVAAIGDCNLLQVAVEDRHSCLDIRVDILTADTEFHRTAISRAFATNLGSVPVSVVRCEDLILLKLLAGRPIDQVDAEELWRMNEADTDLDYLQRWARDLGIVEELGQSMRAGRTT